MKPKHKMVTPEEYEYRCKCGKAGWVEVNGEYPCKECYGKLIEERKCKSQQQKK